MYASEEAAPPKADLHHLADPRPLGDLTSISVHTSSPYQFSRWQATITSIVARLGSVGTIMAQNAGFRSALRSHSSQIRGA